MQPAQQHPAPKQPAPHRTWKRLLSCALIAFAIWGMLAVRAADEKTEAKNSKEAAHPAPGGPGAPAMPPPEATVFTVTSATLPVDFEYVGQVEPSKQVEVRARVKGFLDKRLFTEGTLVKEGQKLYQIDPRSFEADLEIANARTAQGKSAAELAEREYKRLASLKSTGGISQSDLDKADAARSATRAEIDLNQAQADKAKLELSYTSVLAPITGIIGKTQKEIGSLVDDGQNSLLGEIVQTDPIYVSYHVSEQEWLEIKAQVAAGRLTKALGTEPYVEAVLLTGDVYPEHGKYNYEDPMVAQMTGTIEFRSEFGNSIGALKPGQYVKAHVRGWVRPNAIGIPQRAVRQSPTGAYAYVVGAGEKVEYRPIVLGSWNGQAWLVQQGLKPGDRVVVEGGLALMPGMAIKPLPYVATETTTTGAATQAVGGQHE